MEGTHVRVNGAHDNLAFDTEDDLEHQLASMCDATRGTVVVFGSAQNLDRTVTVYRGAKRAGRQSVADLYAAAVASATRSTIPQPGFDSLRVLVPNRQRVRVKTSGEFHRVAGIRGCRVFPEELAAHPERFVLHVATSTARELVSAGALDA